MPVDSHCDLTAEERRVVELVKPYTMTSVERVVALIHATRYVVKNMVPGDVAECGVWRGGSMMAVAATLIAAGDTSRQLYLYDTFEGMAEPTEADRRFDGTPASDQFHAQRAAGKWCYAGIEEVKANLSITGYPSDRIHLIKGKVEDTIPANLPGKLALLRLDTDWYESTKHELLHLFPLLETRGILVIDDYGHWQGARKAVDEYFEHHKTRLFLHRIDYTGRIAVKLER